VTSPSAAWPVHTPARVIRKAGTDNLSNLDWLALQTGDDAEDIRLAAYRTAQRFGFEREEFLEDFIELMRKHTPPMNGWYDEVERWPHGDSES
jgi:hypothetical protein